jgi:hypothetical protein
VDVYFDCVVFAHFARAAANPINFQLVLKHPRPCGASRFPFAEFTRMAPLMLQHDKNVSFRSPPRGAK